MKHIITITITLFFFNSFGQTMPREMNDFFADLGYYPYDQKLEKIDSAIQKNPNESWYYFMRASVYESMGRIEEAGDTYRKVVELNPNDGGSYATLARYYHDHDSTKMDEALRLINKALEMDTTDWYFNVHRGFIYMALKQYENALKDADYLFSLEGVDYMPVTELVVKIFLAMDRKDALKGFMTQYPLTDLGGYMDTKFDILVGDLYKEFGMMDNACLSYQFAADPYLFMDEEVPAYILALLSECNTPYTIKRVPNKDNYYEGNIIVSVFDTERKELKDAVVTVLKKGKTLSELTLNDTSMGVFSENEKVIRIKVSKKGYSDVITEDIELSSDNALFVDVRLPKK